MQIFKKIIFYFLSALIFFLIIFFIDLVLSNTILNYQSCNTQEDYYYELKKNCSSKYRFKKSFPLIDTFTDDMGLRIGKKYIKKDENKENIFIFGDSMTYGVGIEYEKTYAGLISNYFNNYNTYNFAVGSYSPTVHLYKLKKAINSNIIPKKIFIFLDFSDVIDEAGRWYLDPETNIPRLRNKTHIKKESFVDKNFKLVKNIFVYINYNLRTFRSYLKKEIANSDKIKTSIQSNFTYTDLNLLDQRFWEKDYFNNGIKSIERNFDEFKSISKKNNFDIYLVIYPWAETLEFGQEKFNWSKFANKLCNSENCFVIDAIPEFISYKQKNNNWIRELYFLNDEHFNAFGAKLLSEIVINYFKK